MLRDKGDYLSGHVGLEFGLLTEVTVTRRTI